jgi:archaellum biogenesis ATPase FlaH
VLTANGHDAPSLAGTLLSEVEPERVEWLWDGRLPFGKLAVLDGDPGLGKSVVTLDVAARLSSGLELPDGQPCEPAGVVLLSAEDGLRDTIRPRLDAAGANTERIVALSTVFEAKVGERMISLTKDLSVIEEAIERVGAGFVVVDPLTAFLSEKTDSYKDQDMRRALAPLASLAEKTRAAFLVVRHLTKAAGGNTLYRGGGSIAIIGAARSGLVIAQDPEDPERRILAANKHNLSRPAPSLAFRVGEAQNGAARVEWGGTSPLSARDILKEPADPEQKSALSEAKGFLSQELADGAMAAEEVKKDARGAGISERTLKRAKREMGVRSRKRGGVWYWELPREKSEEGQSSAVGTLGTVGPLDNDAKDESADSAYLREGGQGCHEGQGSHEPRCIHEFPGGKDCYLCDPEHPHRRKLEVRT